MNGNKLLTLKHTNLLIILSLACLLALSASGKTIAEPSIPVTGNPANPQLKFPIRAAFYYPWFPQAWKQHGFDPYTNYQPALGFYNSLDKAILKQHIAMMQYANIQVGIASWWGQGSQTDTKIPALMRAASRTNFHWALYDEVEGQSNPSVEQIRSDLTYIRDQYTHYSSYLKVDGKFVVFVYSDDKDDCSMVDRWKQANTVGAYVVLRVFPGYKKCASQPDAWHQYSPAMAEVQVGSDSYTISPGFWLKGGNPRLQRDPNRWNQEIEHMLASKAKWQLVTTFNEWGEGTAVEPADQWPSPSGYGLYLDALHQNP